MTVRDFFEQSDAPTQAEIARRTGIKRSTLNHYITGRRTPSQADAAKIAQAANEPALYSYWYPSLTEQLERMATPTEQHANA